MGFLQEFFHNVFTEANEPATTGFASFEDIDSTQLTQHLEVSQYGEFNLTDAVRPSLDLKVQPSQGYRHDIYVDEESQSQVPVIMAAASREILFPLFIDLIQRLGNSVDVVLETSHNHDVSGHTDLYREHIDMPVLTSILWDYEDLLTNDGCTGIAVLNPNTPQEVQFDEHKLLIMYGSPLEKFEFSLENHDVLANPKQRFITEAEHVHSSTDNYAKRFDELRVSLGLDGEQQGGLQT
jgi:hypothetical protein